MNASEEFDVIVVGAGMAGVACAGSLLLEGKRALLICETPEVGWNLRGTDVDGSIGYVQHPIWNLGWGGGWWNNLARDLNAPVSFQVGSGVDLAIRGTGQVHHLAFCSSASAIFKMIQPLVPVPIDHLREEFERVLSEALAIPWEELVEMTDVPVAKWLEEHDADPVLAMVIMMMVGNLYELTPQLVAEQISVLGAIGIFRGLWCGETPGTIPDPDPQKGIVVPIAEAIEARGGEIWRSAKVDRILVEDGRAVGVALKDGREVRAEAVAISTGLKRIPKILPDLPAEVQVVIDESRPLTGQDVTVYTLLDEPVCTIAHYTVLASAEGANLAFLFPMHHLGPQHVQPGKQLMAAQAFFPQEHFEDVGGHDGAVEQLTAYQEELWPGFRKATAKVVAQVHKHHWLDGLRFGTKLPSQSAEIEGLWYANDGSMPIAGIGVEAAASAGVLRGRAIAEALSRADAVA